MISCRGLAAWEELQKAKMALLPPIPLAPRLLSLPGLIKFQHLRFHLPSLHPNIPHMAKLKTRIAADADLHVDLYVHHLTRSLRTGFGGTMLLAHGDATAPSIFRENIHVVAAA